MDLGIDRFLASKQARRALVGRRVGLLGHPASVTGELQASLDAVAKCTDINLCCAFGPQHGMRGDKQDNMIESQDYQDRTLNIPVFSLYGETRRPTPVMMDQFDVLICDVQDIGCRIYTYITTLLYLLEACAEHGKALWVLDRPNPAGREIEGLLLEQGWESFVGAGQIMMRHGLTFAEMARWFILYHKIDVEINIIEMQDYNPREAPGFGWPEALAWVNPSPNASSLNMARAFSGTVLFEGTELSEGRGTTVPLEVVGAPDIDIQHIVGKMRTLQPDWMQGVKIRPCFFEPTFHKHQHAMCEGIQLHTDYAGYRPDLFKPFRLMSLFLKALRLSYPDYSIWRQHGYEYEFDRMPIDLINGGTYLREWVDDNNAHPGDLEARLVQDENLWLAQIQEIKIYS